MREPSRDPAYIDIPIMGINNLVCICVFYDSHTGAYGGFM